MKLKKGFKRMVSMLLAAVMCLAMCLTGFAADTYSITVENSASGKTYSAYKVFDALYDGDAVTYSVDEDSKWYTALSNSSAFTFTAYTKSDGKSAYYVTKASGVTDEAVIEALNTAFESITSDPETSDTGNGGALKLELKEAGYYYVTTNSGTGVSITTAAPDAIIIDKTQTPTLDKSVEKDNYSIGDTAKYTIKAYVPKYVGEDEIASYEFVDVMDAGLSYDNGSIEIVITGTGTESIELIPGTDCNVTYDKESNKLTISYKIADISNYPADATITITYTATVTEKADDIDIHNKVTLTWKTVDGDEPETPLEDETQSYTFGFDLEKISGYDSESNPVKLEGAEFTLKAEDSEKLIEFVYDETSGTYEVYDGLENGVETVETITTITVGEANIWGLSVGSYVLTETKAPDGYNMLTDPITFTIAEVTNNDGDTTGWTVTMNGTLIGTGTFNSTEEHGVTITSIPLLTVLNNTGSLLPGTGGMGTTLFYVIGGLLVLIGAAFVVTKMRLGKTE